MNGQTWWILLDEYNLIFFSSISNIFVTLQRRCASLKKQKKKHSPMCECVFCSCIWTCDSERLCLSGCWSLCVCACLSLSLTHTRTAGIKFMRNNQPSTSTGTYSHDVRLCATWLYTDYCGVKYKNMLWRILCVRLSTSTIKEKKKYISSLHPFELAPKISYLLG